MYKILILAILISFSSCASLNVQDEYDFNNDSYNYNRIHKIYLQNPTWFYNNYYLDVYGNPLYYNRHPYYIRYQRECIVRVQRNQPIYIPRVGNTYNNSVINNTKRHTHTTTRRTYTGNTTIRVHPTNNDYNTTRRNYTNNTRSVTTRPPTRIAPPRTKPISRSITTSTNRRNHQ